ncbi:MAG TPA: hypothetical protein PLX30_03995 [Methanothrix sp.]|nr:hypothetical protein [Methanothrix sp.]
MSDSTTITSSSNFVLSTCFVGRSSPLKSRSPTTITPSYSTGSPRSILARISLAGTIGRGSSAGAPKAGLARSGSSNARARIGEDLI